MAYVYVCLGSVLSRCARTGCCVFTRNGRFFPTPRSANCLRDGIGLCTGGGKTIVEFTLCSPGISRALAEPSPLCHKDAPRQEFFFF